MLWRNQKRDPREADPGFAPRPLKLRASISGLAQRNSARLVQLVAVSNEVLERALALGRRLDERDVAQLPAGPWLLAIEMQVRAGDRQHVLRRGTEPIRLTSTDGRDSVEPSGRPRIARRWFSNWLVSEPSIVQCPVLWTRGANSFASSCAADVEELERQDADVAERVEETRAVLLGLAPAARLRRARARCRRIPSSCTFSTSGQNRVSPSRPRTASSDSSRSKETRSSRTCPVWPLPLSPPDAGPFRHSRAVASSGAPGTSRPRRRCVASGSRAGERAASRRAGPGRLERRRIRDRFHPPRRLDRDVLELVRDDGGPVASRSSSS